MGLNFFDAVVYINLSHRADRKKLLLEELALLNTDHEKIHRIEAFHDLLNGHKGCALSHIEALKLAKEKGWKHVLILEDDMRFSCSEEELSHLIISFFEYFKKEWDVFFLGANVFKAQEVKGTVFKRVLCAQAAHAYVVNSSYIEALSNCFEEAYLSMKEDSDYGDSRNKAIDQRWKQLQLQDRWYIGKVVGQQRRSYSDIEHQIRSRIHLDIF